MLCIKLWWEVLGGDGTYADRMTRGRTARAVRQPGGSTARRRSTGGGQGGAAQRPVRGESPRARGRPASATPEAVLDATMTLFRAGERVDVNAIASGLGVSRASVYRWFGSRDGLLGAAMARQLERMVLAADHRCRAVGARRVSQALDRTVRWLAEDASLRTYFEQRVHRRAAPGDPQRRCGAPGDGRRAGQADPARAGAGRLPAADRPGDLAYALVRLVEAFLYNDAVAGFRGEVDRLRQVQEALLGVTATPPFTS